MKLIKLNVLLFLFFLGITQAKAQSHNKAASNCVYLKEYLESTRNVKNAVSCIDCYCKICGNNQLEERKKREQEEKQTSKKRAQEVENRKGEQLNTIEQQKKLVAEQRQKGKENAVILVAPKPKVDGAKKIAVNDIDEKKVSKIMWHSRFDQRKAWAGFGYFDLNMDWQWTLKTPQFKHHLKSGFAENGDYSLIGVGGDGNSRKTSACGVDYYLQIEGIINRKGELVKQGKPGGDFLLFGAAPFALEMEEAGYRECCSARIINLKNGETIATLLGNSISSYRNNAVDLKDGSLNIDKMTGKDYIVKFSENFSKEFLSGNYVEAFLYYRKAFSKKDITAYLFTLDGNFKIINNVSFNDK